mmetsp:Transcript_1358/g.2617  ORF Transcript_1358/g.2617 Transcript_1358/m.2617 type:complete len:112 (-) Transcript_1358:139-474(-)
MPIRGGCCTPIKILPGQLLTFQGSISTNPTHTSVAGRITFWLEYPGTNCFRWILRCSVVVWSVVPVKAIFWGCINESTIDCFELSGLHATDVPVYREKQHANNITKAALLL